MNNFFKMAALVAALPTVIACSEKASVVTENTTTQESVITPSANGDWVMAGRTSSGYQKPGAPVTLNYKTQANIAVGDVFEFPVELAVTHAVDQLDLTFDSGAEIELLSHDEFSHYALESGQTMTLPVRVRALKNGTHYVTVIALTKTGEQTMARAFSVPVTVGKTSDSIKKNEDLHRDANGRVIKEQSLN